ncbi:MAG: FAD-dependent oxidoreductase, partial [Fibrobacterales bacterium]|nr:FAD-dependent oxidoreductase [Fibrobacterales bacterium]
MAKRALIVGAGPAGLTAALELLRSSDVLPLVVEAEEFGGGISRTAVHNGNRIDIGGHRFFSKSDEVMDLWRRILPQQGAPSSDDVRIGRPVALAEGGPDPEKTDRVMLSRSRLSRILFLRRLFDYPVTLNLGTVRRLGPVRMARIGLSYLKVSILPKREEKSLEDFMINRFGVELYRTFFRDYTEKVWGVPCDRISPEWGGQRIKGLSVRRTVAHALRQLLPKKRGDVAQKGVETSLIGNFLYPKLGPGQLWETLADEIRKAGGEIRLGRRVVEILRDGNRVRGAVVEGPDGRETIEADFVVSSMPVADLVRAMPDVPEEVRRVAEGLVYRDFMTVGLLLDRLELEKNAKRGSPESRLDHVADNWIYVQESDVKLGRIQIFNNWSPYLVADPEKVWIGL